MKFYDNQFMEQLKHNQKLLKILQVEQKQAYEVLAQARKNISNINEICESQITVVDRLENELTETEELELCSL